MGGRGASSGTYRLYGIDLEYGDEYRSVMADGDMKLVVSFAQESAKSGKMPAVKPPTESMTPGRVYATIDLKGMQLHSLSYMDAEGRRYKQLDFRGHGQMGPHVHDGYDHGEDTRRAPSASERRDMRRAQALFAEWRGSRK